MLNRLIIALGVTLLATSALAITTQQYCSNMAEDARKVMDARQAGVPKSILKSYNKDDKVANYIITRAYEQPMHSNEAEIQRLIKEFGENMRSECYEAQR